MIVGGPLELFLCENANSSALSCLGPRNSPGVAHLNSLVISAGNVTADVDHGGSTAGVAEDGGSGVQVPDFLRDRVCGAPSGENCLGRLTHHPVHQVNIVDNTVQEDSSC